MEEEEGMIQRTISLVRLIEDEICPVESVRYPENSAEVSKESAIIYLPDSLLANNFLLEYLIHNIARKTHPQMICVEGTGIPSYRKPAELVCMQSEDYYPLIEADPFRKCSEGEHKYVFLDDAGLFNKLRTALGLKERYVMAMQDVDLEMGKRIVYRHGKEYGEENRFAGDYLRRFLSSFGNSQTWQMIEDLSERGLSIRRGFQGSMKAYETGFWLRLSEIVGNTMEKRLYSAAMNLGSLISKEKAGLAFVIFSEDLRPFLRDCKELGAYPLIELSVDEDMDYDAWKIHEARTFVEDYFRRNRQKLLAMKKGPSLSPPSLEDSCSI